MRVLGKMQKLHAVLREEGLGPVTINDVRQGGRIGDARKKVRRVAMLLWVH